MGASKDESLRGENLSSELTKDQTTGNFVEPMKLSVTRLLYIISHNANFTQYIFFLTYNEYYFFVKIVNNSFFFFFFGK